MAVAVTDADLPIGVFESGVGGFTVLAALRGCRYQRCEGAGHREHDCRWGLSTRLAALAFRRAGSWAALQSEGLLSDRGGNTQFLATDGVERFQRVGPTFFAESISGVELVDL